MGVDKDGGCQVEMGFFFVPMVVRPHLSPSRLPSRTPTLFPNVACRLPSLSYIPSASTLPLAIS
jgi:hypothetical protein